jgi:hypothetical protein
VYLSSSTENMPTMSIPVSMMRVAMIQRASAAGAFE